MAGRSVTVWMVLGVVCVAAVLLNLSRMEERVSRASRAEGGGAADDVAVGQPLRRGLPANLSERLLPGRRVGCLVASEAVMHVMGA